MVKIFEIEKNNFGLILTTLNKKEKLILYKTKFDSTKYAPYYLSEISPTKTYISGMFYDKKQNKYNGKTKDGTKIQIKIENNIAFFDY
jgi:hypothetical protein